MRRFLLGAGPALFWDRFEELVHTQSALFFDHTLIRFVFPAALERLVDNRGFVRGHELHQAPLRDICVIQRAVRIL